MIRRYEILMGRDLEFPLTPSMFVNLTTLLAALNAFRMVYSKPMKVTSGYRPSKYNLGHAPGSAHLTCQACDFADSDGSLAGFCLSHLELLEKFGLYMEDPKYTEGWVHLQTRRPVSGNRVFIP